VLALLAGVALGSLGTQALYAQRPPPAYFIADVFDISNASEFNTYAAGVPATVKQYGGRYIVRGGTAETLEGPPPTRIVVTAFDSAADAKRWYSSPEYSALRQIRARSARARAFIIEGVSQ
jgi:uncharacterized protein (DUF1330 family)